MICDSGILNLSHFKTDELKLRLFALELRADSASKDDLARIINEMLKDQQYHKAAIFLSGKFQECDSSHEFHKIIKEIGIDAAVPG